MATATLPKHNHDLGPMNAFKSLDCERCQINAAKTGVEIHTCSHGGAFGKRDADCKRCAQLTAGVNVKTALGERLNWAARQKQYESQRSEQIRYHYSSGECARSCGTCCVKFDW